MEQEQPPPEDDVPGSCTNCEAYLQGKCNQAEHQLLFHVCKLRTGTCKEKEEAARQLGELAKESPELRRQVISCGCLPSLLGLVNMPPPWEQVALSAAKAAAYIIPGVNEAPLVLRYSHAILDALKLLLTTATVGEAGAGEGRCHYRHLVARVLAHLIVIIKHEWRTATADQPSTSASFLAWTNSHASQATIQDSLGSVVEIAMMLADSEKECSGGAGWQQPLQAGEGQDASVLTAFSIAQMAHIEGSRQLLVNRGLLPALERWLASPVKDLQRHGASIFASLCQRSHPQGPHSHSTAASGAAGALARRRSGGAISGDGEGRGMDDDTLLIPNDLDVYTRGYIDAKIVSTPEILQCLLPLASSPEIEVRLHVAEALVDLSLQPQNRQAVVRAGGISSLVLLLSEAGTDLARRGAVAENALRALYYLASSEHDGAGGGSGSGAGPGGAGGSAGGARSPAVLIAKEGGLMPLVAILRGVTFSAQEDDGGLSSAIKSNAVAFLAVMSQHAASRVAMLQAPALVGYLLSVAIQALRQVEQDQQQQQQQQSALRPSPLQQLVLASSGEGPRPPEQRPGPEVSHLRGVVLQAVHLGYTLANLASCGEASYARSLVEAGVVPVLLQMSRCRIPEVVDQAARGLALCCRPLTRGFVAAPRADAAPASATDAVAAGAAVHKQLHHSRAPLAPLRSLEESQDEQLRLLWANETLQTLLTLLAASGSSPLLRLEAVRGLAVLARVKEFARQIVRRGALYDLLKLAVDSAGQRQLAAAAEEALVSLGIEQGSQALEVCANDASLLLDWWGMEQDLAEQREAQEVELAFAVEAMVEGGSDSGGHALTGPVPSASRWANSAANAPLLSPGSSIPRATALCGSGAGSGAGGGGERAVGLVGAGLGGLGGIIKEVANLRLRDLLTMCLAPAALPASNAASGVTGSPSLSLSGSGRHASLPEGPVDSLAAALQPLPLRAAISSGDPSGGSGGGGGGDGGSGGAGGSRLLTALIPAARRRPSTDGYAGDERAQPSLPFEPCLVSPMALPEVGCLTFNVQRLMDRSFPSRLLQQEVVGLITCAKYPSRPGQEPGQAEWVRAEGSRASGQHGVRFEAARPPYWRAVQMPSRTYFSFRREGRVLSKLLKKHAHEADLWSISFVNSAFEGEWAVSFLERIHLLPKIRSLVFLTTPAQRASPDYRPSPDTSLASLAGGLPSFIRYLTFDGSLSRDKLVILSHILSTKSFGGAGRRGGGVQQQGLALYGLAVRNHAHLRPDDFLPLLAFFRTQPEETPALSASRSSTDLVEQQQLQQQQQQRPSLLSRQPSLLGYVGLRFLDVSGNRLGDNVSAEVIRAVSHSPSVTAVDLSGNSIKNASLFLDAVADHLAGCGGVWLRTLLLDDNGLSAKAVVRLLSLLEADQSLEVLSLASNALPDGKPLNEGLRALLRRPKGALVDLSLASNRLGTEAARELLFGLLENQSLRFLRLRGNPMQAQELDLIERQLLGNRRRFYAPLLGGVRGHSNGRASRGTVAGGGAYGGGDGGGGDGSGGGSSERQYASRTGNAGGQQVQGRALAAPLQHHRSRSDPAASALASRQQQHQQPPQQPLSSRPPPVPEFEEVGGVPGASSSFLSEDAAALRSPLLSVLFSAPLAWRDVNGDLHPIEALWFDRERELLTQALAEAGADIELRFDYATTDRLRSAVTLGARALHYSGHGHKDQLTFEDGCGGLQLVPVDTLRHLCAAGAHQLELVVVSSCYSRLAAEAFVEAGVRSVVCINLESSITDAAALAFTTAFYLSLAVGGSVQHAFDIGKQAVAASPHVPNSLVETSKFRLLPDDQDHHFAPFPPSGPPSLSGSRSLALQSSWARLQEATHHLPTPPEDFLGREVSMYRAIQACLNRRLVTLLGVAGIGKSALAAAVCRYMGVRRSIPDGIVFVRLQGKHTLDEMIQAIVQGVERQLPASSSSVAAAASAAAAAATTTAAGSSAAGWDAAPLERDEEWLFARLRSLRVLLVLDHFQDLQAAQDGINGKIFLAQLFERTHSVKLMVTTTRPLDLHTLPGGAGVAESMVSVGPLSFRSTVRLFSRLCPHLHTARDRRVLQESLVWPEEQAEVCVSSRDVTPRTCGILEKLGEGVPARVLQRAYQMSEQEVAQLLEESQEARRKEEQEEDAAAAMVAAATAMAVRGGGPGASGMHG